MPRLAWRASASAPARMRRSPCSSPSPKPGPRPAPAVGPAPGCRRQRERRRRAGGHNGRACRLRRARSRRDRRRSPPAPRCLSIFPPRPVRCRRAGLRGRPEGESCARRSRRRHGPRPAVRTNSRLRSAGPVAATAMKPSATTLAPPQPVLIARIMRLRLVRPNSRRLVSINHDEGQADGSQRHRAYFFDRVEFRALARILPQAAAVFGHDTR